MSLVSVPAVYDGNNIAFLEKPPSRKPHRVWSLLSSRSMRPIYGTITRRVS